MAEFTDKQRLFVQEYLVDLNGAHAAIRAGYSRDSAKEIAYELLRLPHVQEAIAEAKRERQERTQVTADRVVEELARIAFYNPGRVFSSDANGLPQIDYSKAEEDDWRVVAEVTNKTTFDKDGNRTSEGKVKHQCKLQALNALARHLGMLNDKVDVTSNGEKVVFILPSNGRDVEPPADSSA